MVSGVTENSGPHPAPATLRWAVVLVLAEALVVAAIAGYLVVEDVTASPTDPAGAIAVTAYFAALAALLGVLCRALWRRRAWARGPAFFLQLMLLPIGYYMMAGGLAWLGVPVILLGLLGAVLLVAPATRNALGVR